MANTKININYKEFCDKVYAAWIGKNIGGTMGGPFEGTHDMPNIDGYVTKPGIPLPNDDLDLQLVWLHAMETLGPAGVNSQTLGEMWLSYITAMWNEYGVAEVNMQNGLIPSMSGDYQNNWADSNGAWIRTEIWATLMPGCPDLAAKYAIEDAKVDHGAGEGTPAAAFVACMQSAAFVINDLRTCIDLGLSAISENSRTAKSVRMAMECYDKGVSLDDARNMIQKSNEDMADGWFEAPSNIAYAVLGMLYGEGDFKKSLIYAIHCGDDTDCTAATVGATLGILGGTKVIPKELISHIGDDIITIALNKTNIGARFPKTCTALTEKVVDLAPHVLFMQSAPVTISNEATLIPDSIKADMEKKCRAVGNLLSVKPNSVTYYSPLFNAEAELVGGPDIAPLGEKKVVVVFKNNIDAYDAKNYALNFRWWLPDGFTVSGNHGLILRNTVYTRTSVEERTARFTITAPSDISTNNRCILEVTAAGRPTPLYIPIVLLG